LPPRKGKRHVLRVIREILAFEPQGTGTRLNHALEFLNQVTAHRAIVAVISDFLGEYSSRFELRKARGSVGTAAAAADGMGSDVMTSMRQTHRRHDVVAVQIMDRYETSLPSIGLLTLQDAERGAVRVIDTSSRAGLAAFNQIQSSAQAEMQRVLRSAGIDTLQLKTDEAYGVALARFFETRQRRLRHG
jgi:uncharacterized protein (DUF58 family)